MSSLVILRNDGGSTECPANGPGPSDAGREEDLLATFGIHGYELLAFSQHCGLAKMRGRMKGWQLVKVRGMYVWVGDVDKGMEERCPNGESRKGESPNGKSPNGESRKGESRKGESPNGESPNGESPNDESPNGERPNGESPNGERPNGENPNGESRKGESSPNGESPNDESPNGESPKG
uniref:Uncharacterized protein n=1 Tax=Stomoxys calcitrans TaxID=35570 RepID=A0A1I8PE13_STOCA